MIRKEFSLSVRISGAQRDKLDDIREALAGQGLHLSRSAVIAFLIDRFDLASMGGPVPPYQRQEGPSDCP